MLFSKGVFKCFRCYFFLKLDMVSFNDGLHLVGQSMANLSKTVNSLPESWLAAFTLLRPLLPLIADRGPPGDFTALRTLDATWVEHWRALQLTPLLYRELARRGWDAQIAPPWWSTLRDDYVLALKTAFQEEEEIKELLQALTKAGVNPILLKGSDLRHRLYHDPAIRPMVDVDFLLAPGEVERVHPILERLGYRLAHSTDHPPVKFIERFGYELLYTPPAGKKLLLEPHWEIRSSAGQYRLPFASLEAAAIIIDYDGIAVRVLSPEHLLLHLCLHHMHGDHDNCGFQKSDALPSQIIDVVLAVQRLPLDWHRFLKEVDRFRCAHPVYRVFRGVNVLIPLPVPSWVWASLKSYRPTWDERLLLGLRNGLRFLSRNFPGLSRHRRLWEIATFMLAHLRSSRPSK